MQYLTPKLYEKLREELVNNLALDFFDEDEIENIIAEIDSHSVESRQKVLALAHSLSHASSSLVPAMLRHFRIASTSLSRADLDHWLNTAFDLRDSHGIDYALAFLSRVSPEDLSEFHALQGLRLREAAPLLETYLRALSGRELKIIADKEAYTDTVSIYLPAALNRFPDRDDNLGLYKLAAVNAWAQTALGSLEPDFALNSMGRDPGSIPASMDIDQFFDFFPERRLAIDLYTIIESFRTEYFLMKELPGLMKKASWVKHALYQERHRLAGLSAKSAFVEGLWQYYLTGKIKGSPARKLTEAVACLYGIQYEPGPQESIELLFDFYDAAAGLPGSYVPRPVPLFIARIRPEIVAARIRDLQAARKKRIEGLISSLLEAPEFIPQEHPHGNTEAGAEQESSSKEYLIIKGRLIEFDQELRSMAEEKGRLPGGALVKGSEIGGASLLNLIEKTDEEEERPETGTGGIPYDEWDYRRGGYRKNWCRLFEQDIPPGDEPFVELTLKRYGGSVSLLKKKFEFLKRERRLNRRQKDGDDIDFDAVVESFSDISAGVSPSENLFVRLERQERDIAVLFLVDMSGSTRGWVNEAEKESLVLLSEALEALGDRYAIYGFSGMTRNRCDLYRIKGFDERYAGRVRGRIAGIEPKDYTRMGPFVRHSTRLLMGIDARTRLLITLTDSRPEDWDGYKGDYGIEDTRKALIEAVGRGIHPFCVTIDREAQAYLPHLFGKGRYIIIDNVRKLPDRITEIYRKVSV